MAVDKTLFGQSTNAAETPAPGPFTDVTAENYEVRARARIQANGNRGFMIARCECASKHGQQFHVTKIEWGAWRAWFRARRISFRPQRDYYMVPTQWPEEFDGNWSTAQSQIAGSKFFDELLWQEQEAKHKAPSGQARRLL